MLLFRLVATLGGVVLAARAAGAAPLATTPNDFLQPGTQPSAAQFDDFADPLLCSQCHGGYRPQNDAPSDAWVTSIMAQASRDPLMRAAATIANADATGSAETCIRCHAPVGWLGGRSTGGDFGNLQPGDLHGVTCHMCHRMLDPIARADAPAIDAPILAALDGALTRPPGRCAQNAGQACTSDAACGSAGPCRLDAGQGRFVVDPDDSRRGPRQHPVHLHMTTLSPFHTRSDACAPCHDVSTPTFTRKSEGTWELNAIDTPHETQDPSEMFPEQRTYSEWRASEFAGAGVVFADGRFGGVKTATLPNTVAVSTCQDCHMPTVAQQPCDGGSSYPDVGTHFFAGANTWVLGAVLDEYGAASGLTPQSVAAAAARTEDMLGDASDLEVTQQGYRLHVRVVNQTGHKLPTGYPEGRRMWLGLRVFGADPQAAPIAEDGAYDAASATLDVAHTSKIYEVRQVIASDVAQATGHAEGTPFHLVLNGAIAFDNRIPPRGFSNAAFQAFGAAPVGATYADGQYWDDTTYTLSLEATRVEVSLYYQTTSREYAEFLRDTATGGTGQNAYDRWVARGRSAPVVMDRMTVDLVPICSPDDSPCDDRNPCTTDDTCVAGACTGPTIPCPDDGNPCTDDVCASLTGTCGVARSGACDDGDACTLNDACASGVCGGTTSGLEGAQCLAGSLGAADVCAEALPKALRRFVDQRLRKANKLYARYLTKRDAGASAKKLGRILTALDRLFASVGSKAERAAASKKAARRITMECGARLGDLVARERDVLTRLR
jgi:hypothetical protein